MQPLTDFPKKELRKIRYVLADIDDTLTENGLLTASSFQALERLKKKGFYVVFV